MDTVLDVRRRRRPDGTAHWRALADLVRHPYLRLLEADGIPLRDVFQNMESRLRKGGRYADIHEAAAGALDDFTAASSLPGPALTAVRDVLGRILRDTVDTWARAATLAQAAGALGDLCETLLVHGGGDDAENGKPSIWTRFPIDAECLFRLMQRIIPALRDNGMADTPLPWPLLQTMLTELMRAERVPFEADPLTGLQVLGMLETRLLRFSRVFMVDVTDDRLPGAPIRSPLLPDSLRALLGLPDTRSREQLAAYTFHRLIAGADEVWLYWQEGVETSGLFDGKKQRSRLVEELIWREEQARGQRLKPGREPLRAASLEVRPPLRSRKIIPKTPAIRERIAAFLKQPLSATRLDAYLTCPLRFYYERLCAILPIEEVNEEDDPAAVGVLLHEVLKTFYAPAVGRTVRPDPQNGDASLPALDEKVLRALFREAFEASDLPASLPPESAAMLSVAGPERLARFLQAQPEQTEVLSLEEDYEAVIRVEGRDRRLRGVLDRVDWREQEDAEGAAEEGAVDPRLQDGAHPLPAPRPLGRRGLLGSAGPGTGGGTRRRDRSRQRQASSGGCAYSHRAIAVLLLSLRSGHRQAGSRRRLRRARGRRAGTPPLREGHDRRGKGKGAGPHPRSHRLHSPAYGALPRVPPARRPTLRLVFLAKRVYHNPSTRKPGAGQRDVSRPPPVNSIQRPLGGSSCLFQLCASAISSLAPLSYRAAWASASLLPPRFRRGQ